MDRPPLWDGRSVTRHDTYTATPANVSARLKLNPTAGGVMPTYQQAEKVKESPGQLEAFGA